MAQRWRPQKAQICLLLKLWTSEDCRKDLHATVRRLPEKSNQPTLVTYRYDGNISCEKYVYFQKQSDATRRKLPSCTKTRPSSDLCEWTFLIKRVAFLPSHWQGITISLSGQGPKQFRLFWNVMVGITWSKVTCRSVHIQFFASVFWHCCIHVLLCL